jgi:hypothetical protein
VSLQLERSWKVDSMESWHSVSLFWPSGGFNGGGRGITFGNRAEDEVCVVLDFFGQVPQLVGELEAVPENV